MVAHAKSHSRDRVEQPPSLGTIAEKFRDIYAMEDILRKHRCEDENKIMAYINNVKCNHSEILEQLASVGCTQRQNSETLDEIEARLAHINYHVHCQVVGPTPS